MLVGVFSALANQRGPGQPANGGGGVDAFDVDGGDTFGAWNLVVAGAYDGTAPGTANISSAPTNGQVTVNGVLMVWDPDAGTAAVAGNTYTWQYDDGAGGAAGTVTVRYRTTHKVMDTSADPDEQLQSPGSGGDTDLETSGS